MASERTGRKGPAGELLSDGAGVRCGASMGASVSWFGGSGSMDKFRIEQSFLLSSTFQGKVDACVTETYSLGVVVDSSFACVRGYPPSHFQSATKFLGDG